MGCGAFARYQHVGVMVASKACYHDASCPAAEAYGLECCTDSSVECLAADAKLQPSKEVSRPEPPLRPDEPLLPGKETTLKL